MDTKSLRQRKRQKKVKSSTNNGNQEVLVLPPDLLKKLGISIGNVNNENQDIAIDSNFIQHAETPNNDTTQQKISDSSILETATLMKKSVFLSPTFVSTVANSVIPGEIEITTRNQEEVLPDLLYPIGKDVNDSKIGVITNAINNEVKQIETCAVNGVISSVSNYSQDLSQNICINGGEAYISTGGEANISYEDYNKVVNGSNETLDNIYSEDDTQTITAPINVSEKSDPYNTTGKINIISEETIPPSKLKKIKKSSKIKSLTPISINTNIATAVNKDKNDISKSNQFDQNVSLDVTEIVVNCDQSFTQSIANNIKVNSQKDVNKSGDKTIHVSMLNSLDNQLNGSESSDIALNNFESIENCDHIMSNNGSIAVSYNEENERNVESNLRLNSADTSEGIDSKTDADKNRSVSHSDTIEKSNDSRVGADSIRNQHDNNLDNTNLIEDMELEINFSEHQINPQVDNIKITEDKNYEVESIQNQHNSQTDGIGESEDMELESDIVENKIYTHTDSIDKSEDPIHEINVIQNKIDYQNHNTDQHMINNNDGSSGDINTQKSYRKSGRKKSNESKFISSTESKTTNCLENNVETKIVQHDDLMNALKNIPKSNASNVDPSKVKEIADFVKKNSHIYTNRNKSKKETILTDSKTKTNKSKNTDIQGVEKPGGKGEVREHTGELKVTKTYARRNHQKIRKLSTETIPKRDNNVTDSIIDTVNYSTSTTQEYCLCSDFGSLTFYEYDKVYEHIHFWEQSSANCELDVIFSIYNDEVTTNNEIKSDEEDIKTENNVETRNICWNEIKNELAESTNKEQNQTCAGDPQVIPNLSNQPESDNKSNTPQDNNVSTGTNNPNSNVVLEANVDVLDADKYKSSNNIKNLHDNILNNKSVVAETAFVANKESVSSIDSNVTSTNEPTESIDQECLKESGTPEKDNTKENTLEEDNDELITVIIEIPDKETNADSSETPRKNADSSETPRKNATKRRLSEGSAPSHRKSIDEPLVKKNIKCGVCNRLFSDVDWDHHVTDEHDLIAWKAGESIDIDDPDLMDKLNGRLKCTGVLKCSMCNKEMKRLKKFLRHVKECIKESSCSNTTSSRKSRTSVEHVTCGVCQQVMESSSWYEHIGKEHGYLAWTSDQPPLNVDNETMVWHHLQNIIRQNQNLICYKCGLNRKRVKLYLSHIKTCDGSGVSLDESAMSVDVSSTTINNLDTTVEEQEDPQTVKCGVCNLEVGNSEWINHIAKEHKYLAWRSGETPLDLDDEEVVWNHLQQIIRDNGGLVCHKCGLNRKRVKLYLTHVDACDGTAPLDESLIITSDFTTKSKDAIVECGVCKQQMSNSEWLEHIGKEHNYLAWQEGDTPLVLDNDEMVWNHLQNIIRHSDGLICYKCGLQRKRVKLYLSHVKTCDGSQPVSLDDSMNTSFNKHTQRTSTIAAKKSSDTVECGVCKQKVINSDWLEHIGKEHNYLAWQEGETPLVLDNDEMIWQHLQNIIRYNDGITCYKCGLHRKRVKLYLSHVKTCDGSGSAEHRGDVSTASLDTSITSTEQFLDISDDKKILKCAVCNQEVPVAEWIKHIGKEHNYLAWEDGKTPLDLDDELAVRSHLLSISKFNCGLICSKCEKTIKYPKAYMHHIQDCTGVKVVETKEPPKEISFCIDDIKTDTVKCGACEKTIEKDEWYDHLHKVHEYMAWIDGYPPLDVNDKEMVKEHLNDISRMLDGLACLKCGLRRKYVKIYLQHIETCNGSITEMTSDLMKREEIECGICSEKMPPTNWRDHAMTKHYNIAWIAGDTPIELNNPYAVEGYLKEYLRKYGKLVCKECGIRRVSLVGFYAHILTCGKTEEETEMFKSVCDICHNKYLRIYKSQHMTMHREAEYALERKLLAAKEKELKEEEVVVEGGRRRAAVKAKTVIEKYKKGMDDGTFRCSKCGFNSETETELNSHTCVEGTWGDYSDSDESVKLESCSEESEDDTDIDSNVSDEEQENVQEENYSSSKNKKYPEGGTTLVNKINRLPYSVSNVNKYMTKAMEAFINKYLTADVLFKNWRSCEVEAVSDSELSNYMPPMEESCKLKINDVDWLTCNRFESKKLKDVLVLFMGASIQCMTWASPSVDKNELKSERHYLAVGAHLGSDVPRYAWDDLASSHGLVQIWDMGNLLSARPKFVLGIAHEYGTVWSMDWCPSGTRDPSNLEPESGNIHRLGLLAVACSNGCAYIYAVPYPSSLPEREKPFYKIKPVAELRLTTSSDRKRYQATAIKWSVQNGHSLVVVGYADGTTAFYDLNGESPLIRTTENNMTVFYPHHDERVHNSCIEDMDMYPSSGTMFSPAGGVVCTGGAGGAVAGLLHSHTAASRVLFPPHWPAALLAGDDSLVNKSINLLEWYSGGRRLGGMGVAAGCQWCGHVAAAALPLIRLLRIHPCFPELHKQVIGTIQMTPLAGKRKLQTNELAMVVEPLSYDDAVSKYGVEFKQVFAKDKLSQRKYTMLPRDAYAERFPLSDVTTMKFCPTFQNHHKLALALHAGVILIANV